MQSKTHSMLESMTNTVIGYVVAVASQLAIFPLFDIHIPFHDNLMIGVWFTAISLARGYLVRRWFVKRSVRTWRCVTGLGDQCCCQRRGG
jgi:hypothetical protein